MIQEESNIRSASVGIGINTGFNKDTSGPKDTKPWTILVCGDFGFVSAQPQKVSSAMIQDFIAACGVKISARIDKNLPGSIEPFSIIIPIKAFSDFSNEQLYGRTAAVNAFLEARDLLDKISDQKVTPTEGKERILSLDLPASVKNDIISALSSKPLSRPAEPQKPSIEKNSFADSILSMMDTGAPQQTPLDNLINAIGDAENNTVYSPSQLNKAKKVLDETLGQIKTSIRSSEGYSSIAGSWYSLRNLLKKIGRNAQISVYLQSAPAQSALESFQNAGSFCIDSQASPDFTVWSYDTGNLCLETIESLNTLSALADNMKTLLFASVAANDPVLDNLITGTLTEEFEQSETWAAFKCLREEEHSRALALCAPAFHVTSASDKMIAGGAWVLADHWVSMFLSVNTPFNFSAHSFTDIHDDQPLQQITPHAVNEISQYGFTVYKTKAGRIMLAPKVVMDCGENESFSLVGFNLLVNRTIRLAGDFFSLITSKPPIEQAATALREHLYTQLEPLNVLSSVNALDVRADSESGISIEINSNSIIDGNSIHFEFTFDY